MSLFQKPKFLSDRDMQRVHEASLYLLENKGVIFKSQEAVEILKNHGAKAEGNIVFLPKALVEKCLSQTPSTFVVNALNPEKNVTIGGDFIIHPAGGEVFIKEADGVRRGQTSIQDFADLQKIYQACDNINMTGYQPLSPVDVPLETRGLHCLYQTMLYTDKPWLAPMDYSSGANKTRELHLYEIVFGKDYLKDHFVTWSIVTPESPMIYSEFSCESIIEFARANQPVALVSAPMSGITSPIHILGTIVQANTETLAGLCLAECVKPGIPVLPSASLTYGNMKLATWECASPDTALMLAGAVQMYKEFYHLPARAQTGVTSSKCLDYQAGFETMQSLLLTAMMDVDVTSQSAGSLENLLTISFEKTLIDDEVINRVRRIMQGINVEEEMLSVDAIMEVEHGRDFLMHDSTLDYFRDGWQADISDWNTYDNWKNSKYPDIEQRAQSRVAEILAGAEQILDKAVADDIQNYIKNIEQNA
ncbi:MAG: trimethylamine methyltransferase family protein [Agathobacter sp.]